MSDTTGKVRINSLRNGKTKRRRRRNEEERKSD